MRRKNTLLFSFLFTALCLLSLTRKSFAAVDISLERETETISTEANSKEGKMSLTVNSNDDFVNGFSITINYSSTVSINESNASFATEDYCVQSKSITVNENFKQITVLCLNNEQDIPMNNVLVATIPYTVYGDTSEDSTYFYVDTTTLDLGELEKGSISDINRPDESVIQANLEKRTATTKSTAKGDNGSIKDFLLENPLYVISAVLIILSLICIIVFLIPEKHKETEREKTVEA